VTDRVDASFADIGIAFEIPCGIEQVRLTKPLQRTLARAASTESQGAASDSSKRVEEAQGQETAVLPDARGAIRPSASPCSI
jgi:hypothetical protein